MNSLSITVRLVKKHCTKRIFIHILHIVLQTEVELQRHTTVNYDRITF